MNAPFLADTILVVHIVYVSFVVFSVPLIIIGGFCKWQWVHNFWFRMTHLLMIAIVVAESLLGLNCPLTVWERMLRPSSNQNDGKNSDFIAGWLDKILFWNLPHWIFTATYLVFGLLIFGLLLLVPMRRHKISSSISG